MLVLLQRMRLHASKIVFTNVSEKKQEDISNQRGELISYIITPFWSSHKIKHLKLASQLSDTLAIPTSYNVDHRKAPITVQRLLGFSGDDLSPNSIP